MNQDETIELFGACEKVRIEAKAEALAKGQPEDEARATAHDTARALWNDWANRQLAECERLKETGLWDVRRQSLGPLEPRNEETRRWLDAAKVDFSGLRFMMSMDANEIRLDLGDVKSRPATWEPVRAIAHANDDINLTGFIFPGNADFDETQFTAHVRFAGAQFAGDVTFRDAQFCREAGFEHTAFLARAIFSDAQFFEKAWFRGASLSEAASFEKTRFWRSGWFDEAQFFDSAQFGGAQFSGEVHFEKAAFMGEADFRNAVFASIAWYDEAQFLENARFDEAQFQSNAWYNDAQFLDTAHFHRTQFFIADFQNVNFAREGRFDGARFLGEADFRQSTFSAIADFTGTQFQGDTFFRNVEFSRGALFEGATFAEGASFTQARFQDDVLFAKSTFTGHADFHLTLFPAFASFRQADFHGPANFNAIRGARAFDLSDATFAAPPDFVQAHFEEAPRLDNLKVSERLVLDPREFGGSAFWRSGWSYPFRAMFGVQRRLFSASRDHPAYWRSLTRLAAEAHDRDREREFFARSICAGRFAGDWPLPWPIFKARGWLGFFRFWAGLLYGLFSNYGRSVALPLLWWTALTALAAIFYLGQNPDVAAERAQLRQAGAGRVSAWVETTRSAWLAPQPCYLPPADRTGLSALGPATRDRTSAPNEALFLALRAGLVFLDPGVSTSHRAFGCLYGVEAYDSNLAPVTPPAVSYAMLAQKLASLLFIFLFMLGLRNMLTMK
ncbi:MAG: pentapeptide repeat-containing protein [Rhodomicrobiaceae bacterium]